MSSQQRLQVWKGLRKRTSGGLTKIDLKKNKRGKLVSKRKSDQASSQNNLGSWLREKGKSVPKDEMLRKKKEPPKKKKSPKKAVVAPKKVVPKKKLVPRPKINKPKSKKPAVKKKIVTRTLVRAQVDPSKGKTKSNINPLTKQKYAKRNKDGYVEGADVSLDNVQRRKLRPRKKRVSYVGQM